MAESQAPGREGEPLPRRASQWIGSVLADSRFALRHFRRSPGTTATMVLVLALGMGVNTLLFTVVHGILTMAPAGLERDDSLVRVRGLQRMQGLDLSPLGLSDFDLLIGREFSREELEEYIAESQLFEEVVGYASVNGVLNAGDGDRGSVPVREQYVTPNYFTLLGIAPIVGSGLAAVDPDAGSAAATTAVISHSLWSELFGRRRDVAGEAVRINGLAVMIVGVAPPGFQGLEMMGGHTVWLPLAARPSLHPQEPRLDSGFRAVARLRRGVALQQASTAVATIAARRAERPSASASVEAGAEATASDSSSRAERQPPSVQGRLARQPSRDIVATTDVVPLRANNSEPMFARAFLLLGAGMGALTLLILLITCTNVAGLLSGLAVARRREIAVRLSLGALRRRIVRQLLTESVLLALAAGALGWFVLWALLRLAAVFSPDVAGPGLQWQVALFTFGFSLATGIAFGVSPALHATRVTVGDALKDSAAAIAGARTRLQRFFVVSQIALTQPLLVALIALVLLITGEVRTEAPPALHERIVAMNFMPSPGPVLAAERLDLQNLSERLEATPGVVGVLPHGYGDFFFAGEVELADEGEGTTRHRFSTQTVSADYFAFMEIPIVLGNTFEEPPARPVETGSARARGPTPIIIGSHAARRLWGDASPLGRQLRQTLSGNAPVATYVVIGVFDESHLRRRGSDNALRAYRPLFQGADGSLLIRTEAPAEALIPTLRAIAREEVADRALGTVRTLAAAEADARRAILQASASVAGAGLVALLLAAIGLYALASFAVARRTREIAIRMTLGADGRRIIRVFMIEGLRLSAIGLLIGLPLGVVGLRLLSRLPGLPEIRTPSAAALTALGVIAVAVVATWVPARRATRVDPATALRVE